jgi:hypothetical protein
MATIAYNWQQLLTYYMAKICRQMAAVDYKWQQLRGDDGYS